MPEITWSVVVAFLFGVLGLLVGPLLLIRNQLIWPQVTPEQRAEATRIAWRFGRVLGPVQCALMLLLLTAGLWGRPGAPVWVTAATALLALATLVLSVRAQVRGASFLRANAVDEKEIETSLEPKGGKDLAAALFALPIVVVFLAMGLWAILPPY